MESSKVLLESVPDILKKCKKTPQIFTNIVKCCKIVLTCVAIITTYDSARILPNRYNILNHCLLKLLVTKG